VGAAHTRKLLKKFDQNFKEARTRFLINTVLTLTFKEGMGKC